MILSRRNIIGYIAFAALAFYSFLMLRIIFMYIPLQDGVAFLQLKQSYLHIPEWRLAFFTHVFTSMLCLLAGFTQFSKNIRINYPRLHRAFGYLYIINILLVTGPAALLMSFYANGGLSSRIAFVFLSLLWMSFTLIAFIKAKRQDFKMHQAFMIRSYALTLSAISLRIWKVLLAMYTSFPPMDRYRIIAWLGWTLNLLIAELLIWFFLNRKQKLRGLTA